MAYFVLWIFGIVLCAAALLFLYKSFMLLKKATDFQRSWHRRHPEARYQLFGKGMIITDVLLAFLLFSFVTQAGLTGRSWQEQPDAVCFFGMGLYCAGRVLKHWAQGRLFLGRQTAVWEDHEIPYSSIKAFNAAGSQTEIDCRKEKVLVPRSLAGALENAVQDSRTKKKGKKSSV